MHFISVIISNFKRNIKIISNKNKNCSIILFHQSTGFISQPPSTYIFPNTQEERGISFGRKICNCSGVPLHNVNSVNRYPCHCVREIQTGVDLQIFLEKENAPFFRPLEKTYKMKPPFFRPLEKTYIKKHPTRNPLTDTQYMRR